MWMFINIHVVRLFILQLPRSILLPWKLLVHYRGTVWFFAYYPKVRKQNCNFSKLLQPCWSRSLHNVRRSRFWFLWPFKPPKSSKASQETKTEWHQSKENWSWHLFSMQIAKWPDLQSSSSPQPTGMYVAGDAVAHSCETVSHEVHMGAVSTAVVTLANLMLKH